MAIANTLAIETDTLRPGMGVNFKLIGRIQPALDRQYLTLDIELPHYDISDNYEELRLVCPSPHTDWAHNTAKVVCIVYQDLFERHVTQRKQQDARVKEAILHIMEVLPLPQNMENPLDDNKSSQKHREKRAFGIPFAIVTGAINIASNLHIRYKVNALEQSAKQLDERQYRLEKEYIGLQNDMITIAQVTADQ